MGNNDSIISKNDNLITMWQCLDIQKKPNALSHKFGEGGHITFGKYKTKIRGGTYNKGIFPTSSPAKNTEMEFSET